MSQDNELNYDYEGLETLQDFIRWGGRLFNQAGLVFGHGTDNAYDEARLLLCFVIDLPWGQVPDFLTCRLTESERKKVTDIYKQRIATRKPAAYLTGEANFAGLGFFVNEHTLVPRSPIAELIAQGFAPWVEPEAVERVLDLCTGSGCIGIASLQHLPNATVDLVDISPQALEVAERNIERYDLQGVARAVESDLFSALEGERYDLIVSNPPYVDQIEMQALPPEYQAEPALGLAAGVDGLDLVRKILAQAADYLTEEGVLIVEVGVSQYYVEQVYPELPLYWFEFNQGGEGVFAINRSELVLFEDILKQRVKPW
ncbi:50S ribosomal protein L3 N(5)-glutamine methyltransferase [Thiomicrospira microaerophila]|uniref:50S ribosomal protein L3 N(5)-glutamine methyltransferase n=1 Tax=Thiomicrospira microaerophila TaxID=406020 RepID=UPI00200FF06A|nr:50S ribosomal protein L3 N(5)-glutamine methyltransferase [Thiomicrospira microaerophila]UQB42953.1 50S ribosomal protein L3 N(5)-glutamine methyltransferase [Thiomicrospira microaerophila]